MASAIAPRGSDAGRARDAPSSDPTPAPWRPRRLAPRLAHGPVCRFLQRTSSCSGATRSNFARSLRAPRAPSIFSRLRSSRGPEDEGARLGRVRKRERRRRLPRPRGQLSSSSRARTSKRRASTSHAPTAPFARVRAAKATARVGPEAPLCQVVPRRKRSGRPSRCLLASTVPRGHALGDGAE